MGPDDLFNPFKYLAGEAGKVIADGWTAAMLGLWNAGLWALRLVLSIIDALLTPDLGENGPGGVVYRTTFWLAGALLLIMLLIQLGLAAFRRSGKSLAVVLVGLGQFLVVWAGWVGFGVAVVYACGGLTRALMKSLLNVTSWSSWQPWAPFERRRHHRRHRRHRARLDGVVVVAGGDRASAGHDHPRRRVDRAGGDDPGRRGRAGRRCRTILVLEESALVPSRPRSPRC